MPNKWGVIREEAEVLEELEELINRKIWIVDEITLDTLGVKVVDEKVIGLGIM